MPSIQSLVITDRQGTPVNHTLLPVGEKDGKANLALADASGAVLTEKRFSIQAKRGNGRTRVEMKLEIPVIVTETINGVSSPKVARKSLVDCAFIFSDESTQAERNDVVGMFASALATNKPLTNDVLVKGEAVW